MKNNQNTVLVLGANGKTGSRVIQKLIDLKVPVRAGSRNAVPKFDWEDQSTWKAALENVRGIYISFQPDLAIPGAVEIIREFCHIASGCGVEKLVLLSGRGEKEAEECEAIVQNSGLRYTIIRASWFNQNFSENYFLEPILDGTIALPLKDVKEPFVDVNDIADIAVASLTEESHDGNLYEVTGPRLLSFRDAINEIAAVTGRNIRYLDVTIDEYVAQMEKAETPAEYIWLIKYLFTEVLDGRNQYLAQGVKQALKRNPKDFSEYVKETAESGVWNS